MEDVEVVIVGGGPAGSTCAWKLRQAGREVIVLDKQDFPRTKPCAGWITPRVVRDLRLTAEKYPYTFVRFDRLHFHFPKRSFTLPTLQYAIRRVEFDEWLLHRSGASVRQHAATTVVRDREHFVIDDAYRCRYLVGAGGTHCPVFRALFRDVRLRPPQSQITALEDEFEARTTEKGCHLWFPSGLPGYSWYVPKGEGFLNIGIGGKTPGLQTGGKSLRTFWGELLSMLGDRSNLAGPVHEPRGHVYYLRHDSGPVQLGNAYIIGDAAGLATKDMGEGIGPAVRSGILAAEAILQRGRYSVRSVPKYSLLDLLFPHLR